MKNATNTAIVSLALLLLPLSGVRAGNHWQELRLLLNVGDKSWTYNYDQLKAMMTTTQLSARGTKKNPAIPLDAFILKDTKLPMDQIAGVVVIGEEKVLLIEGDGLADLKQLVLKLGDNHLTLAPVSKEAERSLKSMGGKPRIVSVERISVFQQRPN